MHHTDDPAIDPAWLATLRARMLEIAGRRVPDDTVEDVVQDAVSIVLEKGPGIAVREGTANPPLAWCFVVLRNVIGNWYQKRRSHDDVDTIDLADAASDPIDALDHERRHRAVHAALATLRAVSEECARWLWAMARGQRPADLAAGAGLEPAVFYRRVYRCRKKLEEILRREGVQP